MDATITFSTEDQAQFIADMPQLVGNGHRVAVDGTTVTLTAEALAVLADLDTDTDGNFDGTYVWIGGTEYRVTRKTGRPSEGKAISLRVPEEHLTAATARAADLGIDRTELFRRYIAAGIRRAAANTNYARVTTDIVEAIADWMTTGGILDAERFDEFTLACEVTPERDGRSVDDSFAKFGRALACEGVVAYRWETATWQEVSQLFHSVTAEVCRRRTARTTA